MAFTFPPYGDMNADLSWEIENGRVPGTFSVDGRPGTPKEWNDVLETTITTLADFLWPRFDKATQSWRGGAVAGMQALTVADLDLLEPSALRARFLCEVVSGGRRLGVTHKALFVDEDNDQHHLLGIDAGLSSLSADQQRRVKDKLMQFLSKFGPSPLRIKAAFQRPRPFQVAYMMNRPFSYEWALSGVTPALMSGHSIQGIVGGCGAYIALRRELETAVDAVENLRQFSVDFGDRRVFAGVHYPSDNIASWWIALRLCDHLFGHVGQAAKYFMWTAISTQSAVFKAVAEQVERDTNSPFAVPLQRLRQEAARPARPSEP